MFREGGDKFVRGGGENFLGMVKKFLGGRKNL